MRENISEYRFAALSKKDIELPFYAMTVGREVQARIYRPKGIVHHQFLFTMSGEGEAVIRGKRVTAEVNTLLYHAPNTPHDYYPVGENWHVCWITFRQALNLFSAKSGVYRVGNTRSFSQRVDDILALAQNISYGEEASVILYKLLLEVNRAVENDQYGVSSHKLQTAMDYIHKVYYRDIELETLSCLCGLSPEYFCRLFKKTYGVTAFTYIRTLRIQEAKKRLLLNKEQSLSQIAEGVGYHSVNYFLTDFKRIEGITPTAFRLNHQ